LGNTLLQASKHLRDEPLDAEWYRQALRLVLSELEDLDTAHRSTSATG